MRAECDVVIDFSNRISFLISLRCQPSLVLSLSHIAHLYASAGNYRRKRSQEATIVSIASFKFLKPTPRSLSLSFKYLHIQVTPFFPLSPPLPPPLPLIWNYISAFNDPELLL